MRKQTIRTFYEVKDGVVKVLHTDPVIRQEAGASKGDENENGKEERSKAVRGR